MLLSQCERDDDGICLRCLTFSLRIFVFSSLLGEESLQFYPSTIACVAILALSRDKLLHSASKEIMFKFISSQENMVEETSSALRTFHDRLGAVSMSSVDSASTDSSSTVNSTGSGDEFVMNLLTLDYMERCISLPSS